MSVAFCVERQNKEGAPLGGGWSYVAVIVVCEA